MPTNPFSFQSPILLFILLLLRCSSVLSNDFITIGTVKDDTLDNGVHLYTAESELKLGPSDSVTPQMVYDGASLALPKIQNAAHDTAPSTTVAALWVEGKNVVYYGGSAKGKGDIEKKHIHPRVYQALAACGLMHGGLTHMFGAKCGEIVVISKWLKDHDGKILSGHEKMIVAVQPGEVVPPCGSEDYEARKKRKKEERKKTKRHINYGCQCVLDQLGFKEHQIIKEHEVTCERKHTTTEPGPSNQAHKTNHRKPKTNSHKSNRHQAPHHGIAGKSSKSAPKRKAHEQLTPSSSKRQKHKRSVRQAQEEWRDFS